MRPLIALGLAAFLFSGSLQAQETTLSSESLLQPSAEESPAAVETHTVLGWKMASEASGSLSLDPDHLSIDDYGKEPFVSHDAEITVIRGDLKGVFRGVGIWKPGTSAPSAQFQLKDNYLSWAPGNLRFDLGWQTFHWGSADDINPTDILNAKDYTQGFDGKKIPVLAFASVWYPADGFSWEIVLLPVSGKDELRTRPADSIPPSLFPAGTSVVKDSGFTGPMGSSTWASRVRGTWGQTTLALSAAYAYDTLTTPEIQVGSTGLESVNLVYERSVKVGFDWKTILDRWGLWVETGCQWTPGATASSWELRHPLVNWTTGIDFNWGTADRLYLNLQYFGQWVPGYDHSFGTDYPQGIPNSTDLADENLLRRFYQRLLVNSLGGWDAGLTQGMAVDFKAPSEDDVLTLELKGALVFPLNYDESPGTRLGAITCSPEVQVKPADAFLITVGSKLAYSWIREAGTIRLNLTDTVGQFTPFNQIFLAVKYQWAGEITQ